MHKLTPIPASICERGLYVLSLPVSTLKEKEEDAFDLIEGAARTGGAESALDALVTTSLRDRNYPQLFEARLLQARHRIGLPLVFQASLHEVPAEQRQAYQEAMAAAARETGALFLADGDILRAWPYFRAIGDFAPLAAAIDQVDSHEQLDRIIEIAFGQNVHPRKGFELLLKHHGICRAITFLDQYPDPATRGECAVVLLRALHRELVENLKLAISQNEGPPPETENVSELIRDRPWLFGDLSYYVDTAHLVSVIPLALDFTESEAIELAIQLCDYGAHLSLQFKMYPTDPPFEDFYVDHAIYLRALAGRDIDAAVEHFRRKLESADPEKAGPIPAEVLVMLLTRLGRYREAIQVSVEHLQDPQEALPPGCPTVQRLCQLAGDYAFLRDITKRRGDLVNFTAAAIGANG